MVEVVTLLTAVVSAAAAAVSAWVAVAQWRASRAAHAGAPTSGGVDVGGTGTGPTGGPGRPATGEPPAHPSPGDPVPPEPAPSVSGSGSAPRPPTDWVAPRSLEEPARPSPVTTAPPSPALAWASGVAAVVLALTAVALVGQAAAERDGVNPGEGLAGTVLAVAMLLSVCGATLATWVIITGRSRAPRDQRRAAFAFAGSLAPWFALTVVDLAGGLAG
jgi:hypothetical protein